MGWDQVADATTVVGDGSSSSGGGKARRGLVGVCVCVEQISITVSAGLEEGASRLCCRLGCQWQSVHVDLG
jgi:hypothetical protein